MFRSHLEFGCRGWNENLRNKMHIMINPLVHTTFLIKYKFVHQTWLCTRSYLHLHVCTAFISRGSESHMVPSLEIIDLGPSECWCCASQVVFFEDHGPCAAIMSRIVRINHGSHVSFVFCKTFSEHTNQILSNERAEVLPSGKCRSHLNRNRTLWKES